ncbi:MAG: methyltransferase [Oscillospiraceae bacterium]|nr:methyltransferase [Oscillospiraceae bacterium]
MKNDLSPDFEPLWAGGPSMKQTEDAFALSTDSVLLSYFASERGRKSILDLGTGAGVIPIILGSAFPGARINGIEINEKSALLARENMAANGLDPDGIITGDIREIKSLVSAGAFDAVTANPPYFREGSGVASPDPERAARRDERTCTLSDVCRAAKYACRWGGSFFLVHKPERLPDVFGELRKAGFEPKRLRLVCYSPKHAPNLILCEARRGGNPGLNIERPLFLTDEDGAESEESKIIYHR